MNSKESKDRTYLYLIVPIGLAVVVLILRVLGCV